VRCRTGQDSVHERRTGYLRSVHTAVPAHRLCADTELPLHCRVLLPCSLLLSGVSCVWGMPVNCTMAAADSLNTSLTFVLVTRQRQPQPHRVERVCDGCCCHASTCARQQPPRD
jgi:hypothetical protein